MRTQINANESVITRSMAGAAGVAGYVAVYVTSTALDRFHSAGSALGFLVPLALSLGVVLAVVLGSAMPARVLGVEWPLAIGGAFAAHATTICLALAAEFHVGVGDPYALALSAGFGFFMLFGVAPRLELHTHQTLRLGTVVVITTLLAWFAPGPALIAPVIAWAALPVAITLWAAD